MHTTTEYTHTHTRARKHTTFLQKSLLHITLTWYSGMLYCAYVFVHLLFVCPFFRSFVNSFTFSSFLFLSSLLFYFFLFFSTLTWSSRTSSSKYSFALNAFLAVFYFMLLLFSLLALLIPWLIVNVVHTYTRSVRWKKEVSDFNRFRMKLPQCKTIHERLSSYTFLFGDVAPSCVDLLRTI